MVARVNLSHWLCFRLRPWQIVIIVVENNLVQIFSIYSHMCSNNNRKTVIVIEEIDKEKASVRERITNMERYSCFSLPNSQMLGYIIQ